MKHWPAFFILVLAVSLASLAASASQKGRAYLFEMSPTVSLPMVKQDCPEFSGQMLYGAEFALKALIEPFWRFGAVGIGFNFGFGIITKEKALLGQRYVDYGTSQTVTETVTMGKYTHTGFRVPLQIPVTFEFLPGDIFNPYVGARIGFEAVGIAAKIKYGAEYRSASDPESFASGFVFSAAPLAGFDLQLDRSFGFFGEFSYNWLNKLPYYWGKKSSDFNFFGVPAVKKNDRKYHRGNLDLTNLGFRLGLAFYF